MNIMHAVFILTIAFVKATKLAEGGTKLIDNLVTERDKDA